MENKNIRARGGLRGDRDSNYFAELDKSIMAKNKNRSPKSSSADKLQSSTTNASQVSGDTLESSPVYKPIYPKLPDDSSEDESDGIDETDETKRKKHEKRRQKEKDIKRKQKEEDIKRKQIEEDIKRKQKEEDMKKALDALLEKASKPKPPKNTNLLNYMIVMLSILALIVGIVYCFPFSGASNFSTDSDLNMTTAMANLAKDFPRQLPSTWSRLIFGIEEVKIHSRPTVFLLVHSGSDDSSNQIAKAVGSIASKYLRSAEEKPLILDAKDFHAMDDHGELNTKYKEKLESSGSMVVLDLESTPGSIAQGLRYYCDEYNPLVESAAIFLTVNLNKCNADLEKFHREPEVAANGIAEKCLTNSWSKELGPDILQPLLSARVMGIVLKIEREN